MPLLALVLPVLEEVKKNQKYPPLQSSQLAVGLSFEWEWNQRRQIHQNY
jgi:hypothetical protein